MTNCDVDNMKAIVLYSSKSGNTGKIADSIVSELNCESLLVTNSGLVNPADLDGFDLIFVGTGIHFGNPNEDLMGYLKTVSLEKPKVFALFVTWGGAGKTREDAIAKLRKILEEKGQRVIENSFFCYGGWNFLRRGHPNNQDSQAARDWAKKIVKTVL
jgi:flavodoxin